MTIKALFPTVRPTLNLDFAKTKALDPRITFTRASTATFAGANGLIQSAASGAARFDHNPTTGESLGLLVEEARTNLMLRSEEFDNASWTPTNATVAANATTSPGGSAIAESLLETTANGAHFIVQSVTTTNTRHTFTFFVKANGRTRIAIGGNSTLGGNLGAGIFFDLSTNSYVSGAASGAIASVQVLNNDWKRISYAWDANAATGNLGIYLADSGTNLSYVGDVSKGVYLWGAQLEAGAFPSSYIPTSGSTVTRSADVASIAGTNFTSWFNTSNFTVFADCQGSPSTTTVSSGPDFPCLFTFASSTSNRLLGTRSAGTNNGAWGAFARPSTTDVNGAFGYSTNANFNSVRKHKVGTAYNASSFQSFADGVIGTAVTPSVNTSLLTEFSIGKSSEGSNGFWGGTIARLAYYPVRLPDAQLQALTAT
jgi:hypothetical protein